MVAVPHRHCLLWHEDEVAELKSFSAMENLAGQTMDAPFCEAFMLNTYLCTMVFRIVVFGSYFVI